jgi:hypothetical protein
MRSAIGVGGRNAVRLTECFLMVDITEGPGVHARQVLARRTWLVAVLTVSACGTRTDRNAEDSARADSIARGGAQPGAEASAPRDSGAIATSSQWQIDPSGNAGPITRETSEAQLRATYGADVVRAIRVQIGEGDTAPGAVLFPDDSAKRLEIIWGDTLQRRQPKRLILQGDRSDWTLGRGVTLGATLRDLERLNGKSFTLAGFSGDYGGGVISWDSGALEPAMTGASLYLNPAREQQNLPAYAEVIGDREFPSSHAAMQSLNPRVWQIFIDFQ